MSRFMRFGALLCVLFFGTNAFAAGYSCPTYKKYTSCASGYYMTKTSSDTACNATAVAGNACRPCSVMGSNYTCAGGTACPKLNTVTCAAGKYLNGSSCADCGGSAYYCPGGTWTPNGGAQGRNSVSSGYYSDGGTSSTTRTKQIKCEAGYYCSGGVRTACSGSLQFQDATGATSCKSVSTGYYKSSNSAQAQCDAGYRNIAATSRNECVGSFTKTGSQVDPAMPTGCAARSLSACTPGTCSYTKKYSGTIVSDCTPTNCTKGQTCTSASANYYLDSGTAKTCSSFSSTYTKSDGGNITSAYCYVSRTKTGSQVNGSTPTNCYSVTEWNACTPGTCTYKDYYSATDTTCTPANCTKTAKTTTGKSGYYGYTNGSGGACGSCSSANSTYPLSDNGAANASYCYRNQTKTGSQVNGSTPTNCYSVTEWNACTPGTCTWKDYNGATDTTCTPANCTKTAKTTTGKSGYYGYTNGSGGACGSCSTANSTYPLSDNGAANASYCYRNQTKTGTISRSNAACSVSAAGSCTYNTCSCTPGTCTWKDYNGATDTSCTPTNCSCTNSVASWKINAGYYFNGTAATACAAGGYCPGTTVTSAPSNGTGRTLCSGLGTGYTSAGGTGDTANTKCFLPVAGGKVRSGSSGTTLSTCSAGTYKAAHNEYYGTTYSCDACTGRTKYSGAGASSCSAVSSGYYTTGCNSSNNNCTGQSQCAGATYCTGGIQYNCPDPNTKKRTTFPANYYNPVLSSTAVVATSGRTAITQCQALSWYNPGDRVGLYEYVNYNSSTDKYDNTSSWSYMSVKAGYYLTTKGGCGNYAYYKEVKECPGGSYCPGKSQVVCNSTNQATVHTTNFGLESCPANYGSSAAKSTAIGQCYKTTSAGKFVKTANAAQETCTAGGYCPGSVKVNYGLTGGRTACAAGTANPNTGSSAASACATCAAGTYNTTTGNTSCATCPAGKWCTGGTHNAACSSLSGVSVAGGTYTSAAGSKANTACKYTAPTKTITGCKTVTTNQVTYTGSAWPATTYSVSANGGYIISGNGTASATCSQCGAGKYSAGGTATSCGTCANWTYSAAGAASCTDCAAVGDGWTKVSGTGWTSYANCKGTKTGTAINANCSAGVLTRAQTSATAWGNPSITTALQAKAGSYVNGQTCTQCAAGTYTASAGTQTSCTAASKGYYVGSAGATAQSACAAGKYQDATGQSSCKSCPALTSGYAYTGTTGLDAITKCTETKAAANVSGYCYGGQLTKTAKDTTTWNTATSTLTAKAGSHISGSGDSTTCAQCTGATYQTTNGSTATACTACVAAESGWTAGTGTGWSAATQCFETKNATAISGYCKAGQLKKNATSATAWPTAANISVAFQANAGSIVNGQTCTQCTGATFSAGGTATSCTTCPSGYDDDTSNGKSANTQCKMSVAAGKYVAKANESAASGTCANWTWKAAHLVNYGSTSSCDGACPTPTSGWTKGTGTGWGAVSSCYQTQTPANCASGTIKQNATSTTAWGASTVATALSANAKYYVNGTACSACPAGKYCTGGTAAATACAVGSYSTGTASACTVCGAGKTTSGTGTTAASSCTSCAGITGLATWATPSWSANSVSNLCTVATCAANNYKNGNACPTCASGTDSKYTKSAAGTTSVNSCYLTTDAGKYVATAKAGQVSCPANSYCVGGTTIYYNTGTTTGGSATCASGTGSKYTLSAAGASKVGQCYLTTTAGNYVATAGDGQTTCAANGYCVGGTKVYYNTDGGSTTTGGRALCNALAGGFYPNSAAGAKANTDCKTNSISGKYVATENATSATNCGTGTYKGAHTVNYGSTSSCSACPDNYKAGAGTTAQNLCKASCAAGTRVATENAACTAITSGNVYMLAHTVNYGSTSPAATACPTSYTIAGKTQADHDAKNDCKITCAAGTQVAVADATCTTPAGTNWYTGAHTVSAGSTSGSNVKACLTNYATPNTTTATDHDAASDCKISCGAGTRIATANATSCTTPSGNWYVGAHSVSQGSASSVNNCLANYKITGTAATDHDAENDCKITCGGGTYIAAARNTSCSNVGVGYWAASSTVSQGSAGTRNACATGLTTIGYGAGADEVGDCGRVLNAGGEKIYLRSTKKTTPSLNVKIGNATYYGNMSAATKGSLRVKSGSTTYSVHDDSK